MPGDVEWTCSNCKVSYPGSPCTLFQCLICNTPRDCVWKCLICSTTNPTAHDSCCHGCGAPRAPLAIERALIPKVSGFGTVRPVVLREFDYLPFVALLMSGYLNWELRLCKSAISPGERLLDSYIPTRFSQLQVRRPSLAQFGCAMETIRCDPVAAHFGCQTRQCRQIWHKCRASGTAAKWLQSNGNVFRARYWRECHQSACCFSR